MKRTVLVAFVVVGFISLLLFYFGREIGAEKRGSDSAMADEGGRASGPGESIVKEDDVVSSESTAQEGLQEDGEAEDKADHDRQKAEDRGPIVTHGVPEFSISDEEASELGLSDAEREEIDRIKGFYREMLLELAMDHATFEEVGDGSYRIVVPEFHSKGGASLEAKYWEEVQRFNKSESEGLSRVLNRDLERDGLMHFGNSRVEMDLRQKPMNDGQTVWEVDYRVTQDGQSVIETTGNYDEGAFRIYKNLHIVPRLLEAHGVM